MSSRLLVLVAFAAVFSALPASAAVLVGQADYTGSRYTVGTSSPAGGLVWNPDDTSEGWNNGGFKIEWAITKNGANFTYKYTITTPHKNLSNWILELSEFGADDSPLFDYWTDLFDGQGEVGTFASGGQGNSHPGMPNSIFGVKFNSTQDSTNVFEFTTTQVPVWGDFYAKDGTLNGESVYAYNYGFGIEPTANNSPFTDWIARPDGVMGGGGNNNGVVPEPSSLALLGGAIGLAGLFSRRRKQI